MGDNHRVLLEQSSGAFFSGYISAGWEVIQMEMDLQYFAEEPAEPTKESEKLEFTHEELEAKINSEYDRRMQKQQAKFDEQLKQAREEGLTEGQKRAKMSAKEKEDEAQKEREAALSKREAELNKRELTANTVDLLSQKNLPKDLAESLVELGDADKISEVVETLQKSTEQKVNEQVKERMRQDPPANGSSTLDSEDDPFKQIINSYTK